LRKLLQQVGRFALPSAADLADVDGNTVEQLNVLSNRSEQLLMYFMTFHG